jgi:uncharacterized protein YutE (UPF0331/DUF86 family)
MSRIMDKIGEIESSIEELQSFLPEKIDDYKKEIKTKAACERYAQKIIEGITDISFMIIKLKKMDIPEEDMDAFKILFDGKLIDEKLYKRLKNAKGMRNILVHEYGNVDDEIVFGSIKDELADDVKQFIKEVRKCLK